MTSDGVALREYAELTQRSSLGRCGEDPTMPAAVHFPSRYRPGNPAMIGA